MKLSLFLYLKRNRISMTEFAEIVGCSREHLSKIINGHKVPSKILAASIQQATNGEVKAEDLLKGE